MSITKKKVKARILGWKIRRKSDGKFMKKGGHWLKDSFTSIGSVFSQRGYALRSLNQKAGSKDHVMDLEIVELVEGDSYSTAWVLDQLT